MSKLIKQGVATIGLAVLMSGCASEDLASFMNTLPDINHAMAPAAAQSAASRGDYKQANEIMRNDSMQQMMRGQ